MSSRLSVSAPTSPSKRRFRSPSDTGSGDDSSAASRMRFASVGSAMCEPDIDRREAFGLRNVEQRFACELEQGKKRDHERRDALRGVEQLAELQHSMLAQPPQDRAHVLAHRQLLARYAVMRR